MRPASRGANVVALGEAVWRVTLGKQRVKPDGRVPAIDPKQSVDSSISTADSRRSLRPLGPTRRRYDPISRRLDAYSGTLRVVDHEGEFK